MFLHELTSDDDDTIPNFLVPVTPWMLVFISSISTNCIYKSVSRFVAGSAGPPPVPLE